MNAPTQAAQPAPAATSTATRNFDDQQLTDWLKDCHRARQSVGYLYGQYICKVVNLDDAACPLMPADPGTKAKKILVKLASLGLLKTLALPDADLGASPVLDPAWVFTPVSAQDIDTCVSERMARLGQTAGRGQDISTKTAWQVWTDAGGRCMFEGCGSNLAHVHLYNAPARIGYLAHIIASDPNGPRGDPVLSHQRSNDPSNIMLMCDGHHRLIDSFAPNEYSANKLFAMRQNHLDLVNRQLQALAYPRAKAITIHADLGNTPTYFPDSAYIEAILATGRSMQRDVVHHIRRTQRDDRTQPGFWVHYLQEHEIDIQQMVNSFKLNGSQDSDELAIFPLHHTPTLILAGRIIGEARKLQVFQFDRQRGSWRWNPNATPQPADTFRIEDSTTATADEVLLTIELTASVKPETMPVHLAGAVANGTMPWVRITMANPDGGCIAHPRDLEEFKATARQAIKQVQDEMGAKRVHLIAISPASTLFCFGQMLQAGNHALYTFYDRAAGQATFVEAFTLSGHDVTAVAGNQTKSITIR